MKFDVVIIGGGLAGLMCGIRLQNGGKKCVIVSAGQSALHFSSGSFDLLNKLPDGSDVVNPLDAVEKLDAGHPYRKVGGLFGSYAGEAKKQLAESGVPVAGEALRNTYRITPMGTMKPTWLTMGDFIAFPSGESLPGSKILIVNIAGFLDFNTKFIADSFEKRGAECRIIAVSVPETERLRVSPTEMRAPNIARTFENKDTLNALLSKIGTESDGFDCVVLPAVFGLSDSVSVKMLSDRLDCKVCLVPTMPPSVPGIRSQMSLRHAFERLGGVFMLGDTVVKADFGDNKVVRIYTENHGDYGIEAGSYVLATGSYFSKGLVARPDSVAEPVFGCDVDCSANRADWYDVSFFKPQDYMRFGVVTDGGFHAVKDGKAVCNLYAIGSVLGGFNALQQGCGAGVSMITALYVADNIIKG